ncbi:MAG: aspartyl protease family protein [Planctomycetes bacterium]|nr:aspartyl protease family protein [Planctomycetota bacterium]
MIALLLAAFLAPAPARAPQHSDPSISKIAEGAHTTRIPFRFVANQVRIDARVNGQGPFCLTLDTGMPIPGVLLYESEAVTKLGLSDSGANVRVAGAGGDKQGTKALMAEGVSIDIGALSISNTRALVVPHPEGFGLGSDGVIGGSLFFHYVVRIDVDAKELVLCEPEGWTAPEGAASVPITREGGMIFTDLRVSLGEAQPVVAHVVVDIGASHALSLNGAFEAPASAIEMPLGRGLSGLLLGKCGRVRRVELGGFAFDSVVVSFPMQAHQNPGGENFRDGNLGQGLLKRFNVTFDYAGKRMLLEKAVGFREPFEVDMSGIFLSWHPDGTLWAEQLMPGSPAAVAGIENGDQLLSIDGKPVLELGEGGVREALRIEGAERRVELKRGEKALGFAFRLRRLV